MSDRMEKTREALEALSRSGYATMPAAALAEVEEWEKAAEAERHAAIETVAAVMTRAENAEAQRDEARLWFDEAAIRCTAAEAERDEIRSTDGHRPDCHYQHRWQRECPVCKILARAEAAEAERDRLREALEQILAEPAYSGAAHDRAVRVISYRALHEIARVALGEQT